MATYCVTYAEDDNWGEPGDRFKTRPPADKRLEEAQAAGRFARLVRWENHQPTELARVNEDARHAQVPRRDEPEAVLAQWQDRLTSLVRDVKEWVERAGWHTRIVEKPINDRKLGRHMVPVLLMERETVEVALNPVSPLVPGAEGAVDLYLVPAYDDIASLYFEGGQWVVHYIFASDSKATCSVAEPEALPLSEETIIRVLDSITSHVA